MAGEGVSHSGLPPTYQAPRGMTGANALLQAAGLLIQRHWTITGWLVPINGVGGFSAAGYGWSVDATTIPTTGRVMLGFQMSRQVATE